MRGLVIAMVAALAVWIVTSAADAKEQCQPRVVGSETVYDCSVPDPAAYASGMEILEKTSTESSDSEPIDRPTTSLVCLTEDGVVAPLLGAIEDFEAAVDMINASNCGVVDLAVDFDPRLLPAGVYNPAVAQLVAHYGGGPNTMDPPTIQRVDFPCGAKYFYAVGFPISFEELRPDLPIIDFGPGFVAQVCDEDPSDPLISAKVSS